MGKKFIIAGNYDCGSIGEGELRYPLDEMEIGDSMEISPIHAVSVRYCAANYGTISGKRFKGKSIGEKFSGFWRITRVG